MGKRLAIVQSNYIPWKGYFDLISYVDEFILFDTVQFTKNDWRNRNKIKTPRGVEWLTIPVRHHFGQSIQETEISDQGWARKHWSSLLQNYAKAPHFATYRLAFEAIYASVAEERFLSVINYKFLTDICRMLGIHTKFTWSRDCPLADGQTERLVGLCRHTGATEYISGPAAKNYLDAAVLAQAGIKLTYINYSGYPEYRQLYGNYEHNVSVVDLIFNEGSEAPKFLKSFLGIPPDAEGTDRS
jgi:hypothetical protein